MPARQGFTETSIQALPHIRVPHVRILGHGISVPVLEVLFSNEAAIAHVVMRDDVLFVATIAMNIFGQHLHLFRSANNNG